eukprot:899207-Prymnesium_polylepis.2
MSSYTIAKASRIVGFSAAADAPLKSSRCWGESMNSIVAGGRLHSPIMESNLARTFPTFGSVEENATTHTERNELRASRAASIFISTRRCGQGVMETADARA